MCFKALYGLAPEYLCELVDWYKPNGYELRSGSQKLLRRSTYNLKTVGFRRFEFAAPFLWNKLPLDVRQLEDLNRFKKALKTYMFNQEYH